MTGNIGYILDHRFDHEKRAVKVSNAGETRLRTEFFGPIYGGVVVRRIQEGGVANGAALGTCRYWIEYDGREKPMLINVQATPSGSRRPLWNAIQTAWGVRAFKMQDKRNLYDVYVSSIDADRHLFEAAGVKLLFTDNPDDPGRTWDQVREQMASLAERSRKQENQPTATSK